jgi:hypothetical protein
MNPQDVTTQWSDRPPVDSEFGIDPSYRRRLTRLGQAQYEAAGEGNRGRVDRIRSRLVDDTPLGAGVGRVVYPLPARAYSGGHYDDYVLKLPVPDHHDRYGYSRDGRSQNRTETTIWDRRQAPWLVPVVAAERRGRWLVMPRGRPVEPNADWLPEWRADVAETLDLTSVQGNDLETRNIVTLEGHPGLCDYGVLSR